MASRGTTFAKMDRDRAKKAKAAEKRARREGRKSEDGPAEPRTQAPVESTGSSDLDGLSAADLLRLVEELHSDYAAKRISFEEFEERKLELMEKVAEEA